MPTSGALNGNNVAGTEGSYFNWQLAFQSVEGNYSQINWQAGWRFVAVGCRGLRKGRATVQGTWVYNDQDPGDGVHGFASGHNHRPALQTASGAINIGHDVAGNMTFGATVEMTGWDGGPNLYSFGSGSWALPQIPRLTGPPSTPIISGLTSTSAIVTFTDGTGGAPITGREIGYGTNPAEPTDYIASDGSTEITGLTPGTQYYFWAHTVNVAGWSPWSARADAITHRVPDAPSSVSTADVSQTSLNASWTPNFDGGTAIIGYELGYGTSAVAPVTIISATSPQPIFDLSPGLKYYFWVRAENAVGWSPWSEPSNVTPIAGVRIKVGAVYKTAVPYVRDGGVWKLARPWVRNTVGVWKETI